MRARTLLLTGALCGLAGVGEAADLCGAVALRDVAAVENPASVIAKGHHVSAITQYREKKELKPGTAGSAVFCSHGGYCYPRWIWVSDGVTGHTEEALRLVNCKVGAKVDEDGPDVFYSVDVVRAANSTALLRRDDLVNRLASMGLCGACADNAAQWYLQRPDSSCAALTKRALEGDPVATADLRAFPAFCQWKY